MNTQIVHITSGKGPAECCWVVAQVIKTLLKEANQNGCNAIVLHREAGEINRTIKSATVQIDGPNASSFANQWIGTIQWTGTSQFRKYHKRKNWFIAIFKQDEIKELKLDPKDVIVQTMRSSGAGGQHVNKVSTAVRLTHKVSGIVVKASDTRSQLQNKKIAFARLQEKLRLYNQSQSKIQAEEHWTNHLQIERGNPIRIFQGSDFKSNKKSKSFKNRRLELKNNINKLNY